MSTPSPLKGWTVWLCFAESVRWRIQIPDLYLKLPNFSNGIRCGSLWVFMKETVLSKYTHTHRSKGQPRFITCKIHDTIITVYCCGLVVVLWGVSLMEKWPPHCFQPLIYPPFSSVFLYLRLCEPINNLLHHSNNYKSNSVIVTSMKYIQNTSF